MYGAGRWYGPYPGRGPFSYLPPWQRPGWVFGRGACWWLLSPYLRYSLPYTAYSLPYTAAPISKEQEQQMLREEMAILEKSLEEIKARLKELEK